MLQKWTPIILSLLHPSISPFMQLRHIMTPPEAVLDDVAEARRAFL